MANLLLCVAAFVMTVAETLVATWEGRADRQSTSAKHRGFSLKAAHWAAVFEALLLLDILITIHNPLVIAPVVVAGAWIGKFWAVERRRKRFRARPRKRLAAPAMEVSSASSTLGASPPPTASSETTSSAIPNQGTP